MGGDNLGNPYLVACPYVVRGTRRANSETGLRSDAVQFAF